MINDIPSFYLSGNSFPQGLILSIRLQRDILNHHNDGGMSMLTSWSLRVSDIFKVLLAMVHEEGPLRIIMPLVRQQRGSM